MQPREKILSKGPIRLWFTRGVSAPMYSQHGTLRCVYDYQMFLSNETAAAKIMGLKMRRCTLFRPSLYGRRMAYRLQRILITGKLLSTENGSPNPDLCDAFSIIRSSLLHV